MDLFNNDILNVTIRSLVSITSLFLVTKLLGKKQLSELNLFDYIIGISIGNFASDMAINLDLEFENSLIALVEFGVISYIISILTLKSLKFRKFFVGEPTILIEHGKMIYNNMKKNKFDVNDLLEEARENGYFDLSEIEYALLEANGQISFMPKAEYKPVTNKDMNIKVKREGLCANVIIDGNIMNDNLKYINKNEKWLLHELDIKGKKVSDILLMTVDNKDKITIYDRYNNDKELKILE